VHWQEIPYGRFHRTIPLPVAVDRGTAKAQFRNGVLEVVLTKHRRETARTVHVNIT
jgi:HSP20 family protein